MYSSTARERERLRGQLRICSLRLRDEHPAVVVLVWRQHVLLLADERAALLEVVEFNPRAGVLGHQINLAVPVLVVDEQDDLLALGELGAWQRTQRQARLLEVLHRLRAQLLRLLLGLLGRGLELRGEVIAVPTDTPSQKGIVCVESTSFHEVHAAESEGHLELTYVY